MIEGTRTFFHFVLCQMRWLFLSEIIFLLFIHTEHKGFSYQNTITIEEEQIF